MEYRELLKRAKEKLPKVQSKSERFAVPKVQGHVEGNKTILINMFAICSLIGREPDHMLKYLQKELATAAWYEDKRLVFGRKLSSQMINDKVQSMLRPMSCARNVASLIRSSSVKKARLSRSALLVDINLLSPSKSNGTQNLCQAP